MIKPKTVRYDTGAYLSDLRRTRIGEPDVSDALDPEADPEVLRAAIRSVA